MVTNAEEVSLSLLELLLRDEVSTDLSRRDGVWVVTPFFLGTVLSIECCVFVRNRQSDVKA